jgi:hypothetical protein
MRILIAEDDEALARFAGQGLDLEGEHYSVDVLPNQLELRRRRSITMSSFTAGSRIEPTPKSFPFSNTCY